MQIMPATYEELRLKHALGPDPFDPGDNILAGAAYLSEMFERYGEGGFLAAYNAGPQRYKEYLKGRPLPAETINYVAGLASKLGLEELAATQSSPSADISKPSTFVALTKLNSARQSPKTARPAPERLPGNPSITLFFRRSATTRYLREFRFRMTTLSQI